MPLKLSLFIFIVDKNFGSTFKPVVVYSDSEDDHQPATPTKQGILIFSPQKYHRFAMNR